MPIYLLISFAEGYKRSEKGKLVDATGAARHRGAYCFGVIRAPNGHLAYVAALAIAGHDDVEAVPLEDANNDERGMAELFLEKNPIR